MISKRRVASHSLPKEREINLIRKQFPHMFFFKKHYYHKILVFYEIFWRTIYSFIDLLFLGQGLKQKETSFLVAIFQLTFSISFFSSSVGGSPRNFLIPRFLFAIWERMQPRCFPIQRCYIAPIFFCLFVVQNILGVTKKKKLLYDGGKMCSFSCVSSPFNNSP